MNLARNYITEFSANGKFSEFAVCGPTPFFSMDIWRYIPKNSENANLRKWILALIDKLGDKMQYLLEAPQCALLEFTKHASNARDLGPKIILIVEIEKEGKRPHYWWTAVPTCNFERYLGDIETFNKEFAHPLASYVCEEIDKKVNPLDVKKCTAFVTSARQTPQILNMPEFFTKTRITPI